MLEIGTGTGYQTAVLARLVRGRSTPSTASARWSNAAESRFRTLRLTNITTRVGDGMLGWPEQAPFDRIIVTAAGDGRAAGAHRAGAGRRASWSCRSDRQTACRQLMRLERTERGFVEKSLADVRFVPLIAGIAERL